jgi:hypothetical protein
MVQPASTPKIPPSKMISEKSSFNDMLLNLPILKDSEYFKVASQEFETPKVVDILQVPQKSCKYPDTAASPKNSNTATSTLSYSNDKYFDTKPKVSTLSCKKGKSNISSGPFD